MHQFDVKTAFLHSPTEEEVDLEQTQEFVKQGSDEEKHQMIKYADLISQFMVWNRQLATGITNWQTSY